MPGLAKRSALLLSLASAPLGCSSDLPEPQWEGEHIVFAAEHPEQVCAGTQEYLDRRAGEMLERLGSDPSKVEYYLLDDVSEYCDNPILSDSIIGCAHAGVVYAEMVPLLHEIVHARSGDRMPLVLEEGLATYFGDPYPFTGKAPRERLTELLTSDLDGVATLPEYGRAAHFVAFLSETFGWESLLELDAELSMKSTPAQVNTAFQIVLGLDLTGVLDEYEHFPECTGLVDTSIACSSDEFVPADPFDTTYERVVDCTSSDGIGPHHGMMFVEELIEVAPSVDGSRFISTVGDGIASGGFVMLRRCGPCSENGVTTIASGSGFVPEADLPAGKYVARYYLPIEAGPASVGVRISE